MNRNIILDQPETDSKVLRADCVRKSGVTIRLKPEFRSRALAEIERINGTIRFIVHAKLGQPQLEVFYPTAHCDTEGRNSIECMDWKDIYDQLKHEVITPDPDGNVKQYIEDERGMAECRFDDGTFMADEEVAS